LEEEQAGGELSVSTGKGRVDVDLATSVQYNSTIQLMHGHGAASVDVIKPGLGVEPPVHVYRRSFLSENRFKISIPAGQNFKHFDI